MQRLIETLRRIGFSRTPFEQARRVIVLRKMPIFRNLSKKITRAIRMIKINKSKVAMPV